MPVNDPYGYIARATGPSGNYAIKADSSTTRQGTRAEYEKYLADNARTLELAEAGQDDLWDYVVEPVAFEDFTVTGIKPYEEFNLLEGISPILAVISAFIPPLAPFAKAAQLAISVSDGDIGLGDFLNIAGAVGFNPLASLTEQVNEVMGIAGTPLAITDSTVNALANGDSERALADWALNAGASAVNRGLQNNIDADRARDASGLAIDDGSYDTSAFNIGDSVVDSLVEGDLKGALLDYVNTGMLSDINIDLNLPDFSVPPVLAAVAAAVDDYGIQPVVQAGSALNDAVEPLTSLVSDLGDVAQTEILDPLAAFGSDFEDGASDLLTDVAQPIEQAAVAVGDTIADVAEPAIETVSDAIADVVEPAIETVSDALSAAEDAVSEAIPSTSINLPSLDLSMIAQLFDMPAVSFRDDPTRTTESLFGDLFKFKTEITRV